MKKLFVLFISTLWYLSLNAQSKINFIGFISTYEIEMELEIRQEPLNNVFGKYRYKGRDAYLDIEGYLYGDNVLELKESRNGEYSGTFYLEYEDENNWKGKWVGVNSNFDATISMISGDIFSQMVDSNSIKNLAVSDEISGTYTRDLYFLNTMWFTNDNPSIEIAHNGGDVVVDKINEEEILVSFNLVCGPTYHLATLSGKAVKIDEGYFEFKETLWDDNACHITFSFTDKTITLNQESGSMECGFGARAHAYGTFIKISDEVIEIIEEY